MLLKNYILSRLQNFFLVSINTTDQNPINRSPEKNKNGNCVVILASMVSLYINFYKTKKILINFMNFLRIIQK